MKIKFSVCAIDLQTLKTYEADDLPNRVNRALARPPSMKIKKPRWVVSAEESRVINYSLTRGRPKAKVINATHGRPAAINEISSFKILKYPSLDRQRLSPIARTGRRSAIQSFTSAHSSFMQITQIPFGTTDWTRIESVRKSGETGWADWKVCQFGTIRVRVLEYSPGYKADHWCSKGHILYCLEGELVTELEDGRTFVLLPGMSYQVAGGAEPHRSYTTCGAKLFVVD